METTTTTTTSAPVEKLYGRELADKLREEREQKRVARLQSSQQ